MTMNLQEVEAKLADVQSRFNEAQTKKAGAKDDMESYEAELYRLQGEFRVLNQMKDVIQQADGAAPNDPALMLEAKPKKEGKE